MSSSTTTIENLPPEMISELFRLLHPKDLAACSLVNKRWNWIYSNFKLHRLVAIDHPHDRPNEWYETGNKIEEKEMCHPDQFYRLAEKPIVSNLRYLALFESWNGFELTKLNRFSQLVHLEIHTGFLNISYTIQVNLNLPELKVLVIHRFNRRYPLLLNCPQLGLLVYRGEPADSNLLEVMHPETIRKLETDMLDEKLSPFINVECLATRDLRLINRTTLLLLPKLKELHFKLDWTPFAELNDPSEFLQSKEQLKQFLDDVNSLRTPGSFRFRFAAFELNKAKLEQIDFNVQIGRSFEYAWAWEYLEFYMKNYDLIDGSVDFHHPVNHTLLMRQVDGKLPSDFFEKITKIQKIVTFDTVDIDQFLSFLKSLRSLRMLYLIRPKLGQEFYDQLPALAQSLDHLELFEHNDEIRLNFEFLLRLPRFSKLNLFCGEVSPESERSLIHSVGKQVQVTFYSKHYAVDKWGNSILWKARRKISEKPALNTEREPRGEKAEELQTKEEEEVLETDKVEELLDFFQRCVRVGQEENPAKRRKTDES